MRTMLTVLLLLVHTAAWSADTGRRYDSKSGFQGTYRITESGIIRLYDPKGNFEGTIVPGRDKGSFRRYDWNNSFLGSGDEDDSDADG